MIGQVVALDAVRDLGLVDTGIAGHDQPVGDLHDERGVVEAAIGVDQEPREPGEQRRHAEEEREPFRHARRPEVVGDMAVEVMGKQPEGAVSLWDRVLGVVAEDEEAKARVPLDAAIGLVAQVLL